MIRCAANTSKKRYNIAVLPGDGVGNEVIPVAVDALCLAGSLEGSFYFTLSPNLSDFQIEFSENSYFTVIIILSSCSLYTYQR